MKKLAKIISAAVVSTAFLGSAASAATCNGTISITNTGPGSNNTIVCNDVKDITFTCDNNVLVLNYNKQNGESGSATVNYNTHSGAAVTGSVTNENNTTTNLSTACGPATTTTSDEPGRGGAGGGGAGAFVPEMLPNTANESPVLLVLGTIAGALGLVAVSRMAVVAYRKLALR